MVTVNNKNELLVWLSGKSSYFAITIAARAALRVLPLLEHAEISDRTEAYSLLLPVFRANILAWDDAKYPPQAKILAVVADAAADAAAYASAAFAAYATAAANAAAAAAYAADAAGAAAAAESAAAAADTAAAAARGIWADISRDINFLVDGGAADDLAGQTLLLNSDLKKRWEKFRVTLLARGDDWDVWVNWYEDRLAGRETAGLPSELAQELDLKIAAQSNVWWERPPTEVNADITLLIMEAKRKVRSSVAQFQKRSKKMSSPRPIFNDNGQLDVTSATQVNEAGYEEGLELLPERARRQIKNLLSSLGQSNSLTMLRSALESYLSELEKGFDFEITYLDDDMAIICAEREADREGFWYKSGVKTALDVLFEIHKKIQNHYPFDLKREEYIRQSPVDPARFDAESFGQSLDQVVIEAQRAYDEGKVTDAYLRAVQRQQQQYRDISTLPKAAFVDARDGADPAGKHVPHTNIKKRFLFQSSGFWGNTLDIAGKLTKVLDSDIAGKLGSAAAKVMELIWNKGQ